MFLTEYFTLAMCEMFNIRALTVATKYILLYFIFFMTCNMSYWRSLILTCTDGSHNRITLQFMWNVVCTMKKLIHSVIKVQTSKYVLCHTLFLSPCLFVICQNYQFKNKIKNIAYRNTFSVKGIMSCNTKEVIYSITSMCCPRKL